MQRLLSFGVVVLFVVTTSTTLSGNQERGGNDGIKDRFVGAWRLVSLEAAGPEGKIPKADSTGLFVFTRDGHASVQVMERNPTPQAAAGPDQYSAGGCEATFGT
jgi:Lipocalin-like domain